jgi:cation diffusion facilitator CzcD-associated flavoprotein CzcO
MRSPRVAIVGTGISGICLAVLMKQAGFESFTMYEKADDVGGVWRDNRYPGLHCDIPSLAYTFTFAPNPDWTSFFSSGPEIHAYLGRVTDEFGIRAHIRFRTEVTGARWTGDVWQVTDSSGRVEEYNFLVSATGLLHVPSVPSIPGMESFKGDMCHTARWEDVELKGRRVAVVGMGSSGVQLVCAIADEVSEVVHICRTPQWMLPFAADISQSWLNSLILRRFPSANKAAHRMIVWAYDIPAKGLLKPGLWRKALHLMGALNLRRVKDRALRAALTPDYPLGCKRAVNSIAYYTAIQKPNVRYVPAGVDQIDATGLTTSDGVHHEVDVIVLATGFKFSMPMQQVSGDSGQLLEDVWAQSPKNYRTVAVAGFPNFFCVNGAPQALTSLCWSAEVQARYVVRWLELYRDGQVDRAVVREEAQDRFLAKLTAAHPDTVFLGCQSYFLSADGTPMVLAMEFGELAEMLREPVLDDYATVGS